jgi:hypothetical protein
MLTPQNVGNADDVAFVLFLCSPMCEASRLTSYRQNFIDSVHDLAAHGTSEQILLAEIETISEALKGDEGEQRPHDFKSTSFSIPTTCGYCQVERRVLLSSVPEFVDKSFIDFDLGSEQIGKDV